MLAEFGLQVLGKDPRGGIDRATCGNRYNDRDRSSRVGLRLRRPGGQSRRAWPLQSACAFVCYSPTDRKYLLIQCASANAGWS
jgi:hypothetical protein